MSASEIYASARTLYLNARGIDDEFFAYLIYAAAVVGLKRRWLIYTSGPNSDLN